MMFTRLGTTVLAVASLQFFCFASSASAQVGSGWSAVTYTKKIQLAYKGDIVRDADYVTDLSYAPPGGAAVCRFHYLSDNDSEYFDLYNSQSNRCEIRVLNSYSSGNRQFQGYVRISSPLNNQSLFQIFGSSVGATQMMIRGYSENGGSIKATGTPSVTMATGIYGVEQRINVIHLQGQRIEVYCNASLKGSGDDNESGVTNYFKYGVYGTHNTTVQVRWRQVRFYQK